MVRPPSSLDRWNAITKFITNPCDAPWTVYLETALEPLGNLVLTLSTFGMTDVARGFFRPRGLRSGRHARRGFRGGKPRLRFRGIPEGGELIGKNIPGAQELSGRQVSQGVRHMWAIDGIIQRALWNWLVADVTEQFFYEWTSAIQQTEFCQATLAAAVLRTADGGGVLAIQDWTGLQHPDLQYSRGNIFMNPTNVFVPGGPCVVSVGASFRNTFTAPQNYQVRLTGTDATGNVLAESANVLVQPGDTGDAVASADVVGFANVQAQKRVDIGFGEVASSMFFAQTE